MAKKKMSEKMKNTIAAGIFLVLAAILPAIITVRKDKAIEEMQAKYEATIAAMQQQTVAEKADDAKTYLKWSDVAQRQYDMDCNIVDDKTSFLMGGIQWHNGFFTEQKTACLRYSLNGDFTELRMIVGVLDNAPGENYSEGRLYVRFDNGGDQQIDLNSQMKAKTFIFYIPKGAKEIQFDLQNHGEEGKRPGYGFGELKVSKD